MYEPLIHFDWYCCGGGRGLGRMAYGFRPCGLHSPTPTIMVARMAVETEWRMLLIDFFVFMAGDSCVDSVVCR